MVSAPPVGIRIRHTLLRAKVAAPAGIRMWQVQLLAKTPVRDTYPTVAKLVRINVVLVSMRVVIHAQHVRKASIQTVVISMIFVMHVHIRIDGGGLVEGIIVIVFISIKKIRVRLNVTK